MIDCLRIFVPDLVLHVLDNLEDSADDLVEIFAGALFARDYALPVPLVDVAGVKIVEILVPADRVHIRVQSFAGPEAIMSECPAFPFCERLDDLEGLARHSLDVEGDRPLDTVQVVVETGRLGHKQRGGNAVEVHFTAKFILKQIADELDRLFRLADGHVRIVIVRENQLHAYTLLMMCFREPAMCVIRTKIKTYTDHLNDIKSKIYHTPCPESCARDARKEIGSAVP